MGNGEKSKLFVLDTNVILHDTKCLFGFPNNGHENNICLVQPVLNELDALKSSLKVGYESRRFIEILNRIRYEFEKSVQAEDLRRKEGILSLHDGMPIDLIKGKIKAKFGKLYLFSEGASSLTPENRGDGNIIRDTIKLKDDPRFKNMEIIFVTNDNNCAFNAANFLGEKGIKVDYYKQARVERPFDALYDYKLKISNKKWNQLCKKATYKNIEIQSFIDGSKKKNVSKNRNNTLPYDNSMRVYLNQHVIIDIEGGKKIHGIVREINPKLKTFTFRILTDYTKTNKVFGFNAKDEDQNFALNILLDPDIKCIALLGRAGSGKTLLALVAAYKQIFEDNIYESVIVTREVVPASSSRDLGFLPGDLDNKYGPWMGLVSDNIKKINTVVNPGGNVKANIIIKQNTKEEKVEKTYGSKDLNQKTELLPTLYVRGRSIHDYFIINEEAQNNSQEQVKTLITRAAEGTKVIITGNTNQIDDPHLSPETCGLTHVTTLLGNKLFAMVYIDSIFRSELAELAENML